MFLLFVVDGVLRLSSPGLIDNCLTQVPVGPQLVSSNRLVVLGQLRVHVRNLAGGSAHASAHVDPFEVGLGEVGVVCIGLVGVQALLLDVIGLGGVVLPTHDVLETPEEGRVVSDRALVETVEFISQRILDLHR